MLATLLTYLGVFIGLLLLFQIIFFEVMRSRAIKSNNYEWFNSLKKPFNYTRTGSMIFVCVICYFFGGSNDTSNLAQWLVYLVIFVACGVIADALTQWLVQKYGLLRCRKQLEVAGGLDDEFNDLKNNFVEDESYEVSQPRYNETLIARQYLKPADHMAFMSVDKGEYAKHFGTYSESVFDVEPYFDATEVQQNLVDTPVRAIGLAENNKLPFKDGRMDLIFDEYSNYDKNEVTRVLKPGGIFIVNQYGTNNLKEFLSMYMPVGMRGSWDLKNCQKTLESAGYTILEGYEDYGYIRFRNIAQLHTYLKKAVPDDAEHPEKYRAFYTKALQEIKKNGFFQLTTYRFLTVARR